MSAPQHTALSPAEVTALTGVSTDSLRDWRRREMFGGFGQRDENGRWSYSPKDVLRLCIAQVLGTLGVDMKTAISATGNLVMRRAFIEHINTGEERVFALSRASDGELITPNSTCMAPSLEALGRHLDANPNIRWNYILSVRQACEGMSDDAIAFIRGAGL